MGTFEKDNNDIDQLGGIVGTEIHDKEFAKNCIEMIRVHEAKSSDYDNAFNDARKICGNGYAVGLLYNKVRRLISLLLRKNGSQLVKDESVNDTLLDNANYSIMLKVELEKERKEHGESK